MDSKTIATILSSGNVKPLDSEFEIEELILSVNGINEKISWYKELKKQRMEKITSEIDKLEGRRNLLKEIIISTLKKNEKTSLNFPGIGKVVMKKTEGIWKVEDEESLIKYLEKELDKDEFEKVVKIKESIVKAVLDKKLDMWEQSGSLPSSVAKEEGKESVAVIIDKDFSDNKKMQEIIQSVESVDVEDMDDLEI